MSGNTTTHALNASYSCSKTVTVLSDTNVQSVGTNNEAIITRLVCLKNVPVETTISISLSGVSGWCCAGRQYILAME